MEEFGNSVGGQQSEQPGMQNAAEDRRQTVYLEERKSKWNKNGKKGRPGIKIFLLILGLVLLLVAVTSVSCDSSEDYGASGPYIASLYVEGTIQSGNVDSFGMAYGYQHQWTLSQIEDLMYDSENRGILLYVDSPGGGVYESDELYLKLLEYKEATGNPVYVYMGATAASGGYYIAAAADKIYANRNTWTGSIGVTIGTIYDFSEFLSRYGVKSETITSGANKAMGSYVDPMTAEQRQIWQSLVDEAYNQFAGVVAEGRNLPIQRVKQIGDGRIYSAKQALELGLVDEIGAYEDAVRDMEQEYSLHGCDVVDVTYHESSFWRSLLSGIATGRDNSAAAGSEAEAVLALTNQNGGMPISYTCEWLMKK